MRSHESAEFRPRHRMPADEDDAILCRGGRADPLLRSTDVGEQRSRAHPGGDEGKHLEQGLCWRAEDDGVAGFEGSEIERGRGVHGPLVDRQVPGARVDVDSGDPGSGSRTPQRERERAADEAEADDDDTLEHFSSVQASDMAACRICRRGRGRRECDRKRPQHGPRASAHDQRGQQERSHRTALAVTRVQALSYRKRTLKNVVSARTSASWVAPDLALASATAAAYPPSPQATSPRIAWLQAVPSTSAAPPAFASTAVGAR